MQTPRRYHLIGLTNLAIFGIFMLVAGVGSIVPTLVKDRLPEQFKPLWYRLLAAEKEEWSIIPETLAVISQWAIGLTELAIGACALLALFLPKRRDLLAAAALVAGSVLFGTFMIVLFLLHEADLPRWNQFPAILVWLAAIWFIIQPRVGRM